MNTASPELSLESKPYSYSMLLKSFGEKLTDQTHENLEGILARLEEEKLKIDAFKRELPLCMQLLTNAMETSKEQLRSYRENQGRRPVLEEFIPLKINTSTGEGAENKAANNTADHKANWMTSAQLWSPGTDQETKQRQSINVTSSNQETNMGFSVSPKERNEGAFLPFTKDNNSTDLALASPKQNNEILVEDSKANSPTSEQGIKGDSHQSTGGGATNNNNSTQQQAHRKARRCWSPDLHRRFVNALQMLGGSQVATPKQIRELMKVEGLTNDEVKSHLQKYRLHTRRPSPSPHAAATSAPQLVVLGGIWVPPEYASAAHVSAPPTTALYHPSITAPPAVAQQFYHSPATPQPLQSLHHLQHHHQQAALLHMYSNLPSNLRTHRSPESNYVHGDRSESIEDGKSESSSWKADSSSENCREKNEHRNEITHKF